MAPKKKPKVADRHTGFVVRLPLAYREKVQELKRKTRRPITVEVQMALDTHLKANGIEPPIPE